ncbi:glycosyl hydrolase family protein [Striga asiatica]|uniref:Glycosyl hydrolase family protein n=1 Tax=Striga asiatica TaxID=4170 RepID=A0A5A7RBQ1_STRAF|nr:glycosyl hydrolase family protein [Striga asiatica]
MAYTERGSANPRKSDCEGNGGTRPNRGLLTEKGWVVAQIPPRVDLSPTPSEPKNDHNLSKKNNLNQPYKEKQAKASRNSNAKRRKKKEASGFKKQKRKEKDPHAAPSSNYCRNPESGRCATPRSDHHRCPEVRPPPLPDSYCDGPARSGGAAGASGHREMKRMVEEENHHNPEA